MCTSTANPRRIASLAALWMDLVIWRKIMLNFKLSELIHSDTAINNNINNMPDINSLDNLLNLIVYCLQPIRELIKKPMIITSGYRNAHVNQLVGGAATSRHCLGEAADFKIKGMKPNQIIQLIQKSNLVFDQLINEHNLWVHISYRKGKNRKQVLTIN